MRRLALPLAQQRRLEKLAREAGRTPESMLRFVLRDGFDYCSYVVNEVNTGLKSVERGERTYSTSEVLRHARSVSGKRGGCFPKAA